MHTLTLENGLGQTLFFGDRPSREVGVTPTEEFLKGLGFSPTNPPNAALIPDAGDGETDLAVLELFSPTYDPSTHSATYQVKGLEAWEDSLQFGLQQTPVDLSGLTPDFSGAHLLIDDCADAQIGGNGVDDGSLNRLEEVQTMCYNYAQCMPCTPYGHNQPNACATYDYWATQCNQASYACPSGNCTPTWGDGISGWLGC
jgi:hypothetical protein